MSGANQFAPTSFLSKMKAIASLEAMAKFIQSEQVKGNNQTANLKLANLAYESLCTSAGKRIRKVAFSHEAFTTDGDSVVQNGLAEINQAVSDIWKEVETDLAGCSASVAKRMFEFKFTKDKIVSRIEEVEKLVDSRATCPKPDQSNRIMPEGDFINQLRDANYDVSIYGAGILPRVDTFVSDHGSAFRAAAEVLTSALNEDYRTQDGKKLTERVLLAMNNSQDVPPAGDKDGGFVLVTADLPGSVRGVFTLPEVDGEDGLCQIANSITFKMEPTNVRVRTMVPPVNGIWSPVSCKKRLAEMKTTLEVLDKWYDDIYVKMWGDQAYSIALSKGTAYRELSDPQTRELKLCVSSIFGMMMQACAWTDQYAFNVCEAMLRYMEVSMNRYA